MRFLIIDDFPGRYDEFCRLLDEKGFSWIITIDSTVAENIMATYDPFYKMNLIDGIFLDHDMPKRDGRAWAKVIAEKVRTGKMENVPVIISSCTGLENVREEMLATLHEANIGATINPADHLGCEQEWLAWFEGYWQAKSKNQRSCK